MTEQQSKLPEEPPDNWGRWGSDDELGAINYLDDSQVLRGIAAVEDGRTFALGTPINHSPADPAPPGGTTATHHMTLDRGYYLTGKADSGLTNIEWSGDVLTTPVHGTTTHIDSVGHCWYDGQLYNGFDAKSTIHGLNNCDIEPVASHGVIGRGVLLDIARYRGVDYVDRGKRITGEELRKCATEQDVTIKQGDILIVRTGAMDLFYDSGPEAYAEEYVVETESGEELREPGPTYSSAFLEWIDDREIPLIATDTITGEWSIPEDDTSQTPLHPLLLRDMGVLLSELHLLGELARDCASDGRWAFLYVCSPLRIVGGTGSPVNPVAIK